MEKTTEKQMWDVQFPMSIGAHMDQVVVRCQITINSEIAVLTETADVNRFAQLVMEDNEYGKPVIVDVWFPEWKNGKWLNTRLSSLHEPRHWKRNNDGLELLFDILCLLKYTS